MAAFLYFRPVLCIIPPFRSVASVSPGSTVPVDGPPSSRVCSASNAAEIASTPAFDDVPGAAVILPYYDNSRRYVLGPADMNGSAVAATSVVRAEPGGYQVELTLTTTGAVDFLRVAAQRYPFYAADPSNPPSKSLEAIELNGTVVSAPPVEAASFNGIVVIGGTSAAPFTRKQADGLAQHIDLARSQPPPPGATSTTS